MCRCQSNFLTSKRRKCSPHIPLSLIHQSYTGDSRCTYHNCDVTFCLQCSQTVKLVAPGGVHNGDNERSCQNVLNAAFTLSCSCGSQLRNLRLFATLAHCGTDLDLKLLSEPAPIAYDCHTGKKKVPYYFSKPPQRKLQWAHGLIKAAKDAKAQIQIPCVQKYRDTYLASRNLKAPILCPNCTSFNSSFL